MNSIIDSQGRHEKFDPTPGSLSFEVNAKANGVVTDIDNLQLAKIARIAGAPMDKRAGVDLLKKLGEPVSKGEPLYRVHAEFPADFQFAKALCKQNSGYSIGKSSDIPQSFVAF